MRSHPPKYAQVADELKTRIHQEVYPRGAKLPSETELMEETGFSRATVRKALDQLAQEGWIETRQGMGSLVLGPPAPAGPVRREVLLLVHYPDHSFFPRYIDGIEEVLQKSAYTLVTKFTHNRADVEERLLEDALEAGYAAILLFPAQSASLRRNLYLYKALEHCGKPVILLSNPILDTQLPVVTLDDYTVGSLAGQHLAALGHRSVLCLMNGEDHSSHLRQAGFLGAWHAHGLSHEGRHTVYLTRQQIPDLFSGAEPLLPLIEETTAAFCYNDDVAFRLVRFLQARGIPVPEAYSVIGCDDSEYAALCPVPLTTVRQDPEGIGRAAAQAFLRRLQNPHHNCNQTFPPKLVVRRSTSIPKKDLP